MFLKIKCDIVCVYVSHGQIEYMDNNADAWLGWTWWATGPLWTDDYMFTLEPIDNGNGTYTDKPQMAVLESHIDSACGYVLPPPFVPTPSPDQVEIPIMAATSPVPQQSPANLAATFDSKH